jgi:hypothetical protein
MMTLGDDKFDTYALKAIYSPLEVLFWAKVKTPWPVSPRDMCCIVSRASEDGEYAVMASVEDASVPAISGNVRAELWISGWKVRETETGVQVTYITQIDLKGSIPGAFLKNIQIQVPLCAKQVVRYAEEHGYPPYVWKAENVEFEKEDFDHESKTYSTQVKALENAVLEFDVSTQMYPQGPQVQATNAKYTLEDGKLKIHDMEGVVTVVIN